MPRCTLCDLPTPDPPITADDVDGTFCCRGCLDVARLLGDLDTEEADAVRAQMANRNQPATVPDDAASAFLRIDGMHCATCEAFIETIAQRTDGVYAAEASYASDMVKLQYDADRLDDAGVADEVIDVVVAVSFPEQFAVDRDARGRGVGGTGPAYRGRLGTRLYGRGYYAPDPFYFGYTPFGYGYSRLGWWYGAHRPTVVIVSPRDDADRGGRVVNERGYTRGAGPGQNSAGATRIDLPPRGSVSPSGASSGRSSGSTGRKAKPRDGSSGDGGGSGGGA